MFQVKWPMLQAITPGLNTAPGVIVRDSEWTIVVASPPSDSSHVYVQLPADCDVGDFIEIHQNDPTMAISTLVLPPSGETFIGGNLEQSVPRFYRKIAASMWSFH